MGDDINHLIVDKLFITLSHPHIHIPPFSNEGSELDPYRTKRNAAWLAVLGTAAAAAVLGLVAYIILKKKHQKAFSHRKLVEEFPSDPGRLTLAHLFSTVNITSCPSNAKKAGYQPSI